MNDEWRIMIFTRHSELQGSAANDTLNRGVATSTCSAFTCSAFSVPFCVFPSTLCSGAYPSGFSLHAGSPARSAIFYARTLILQIRSPRRKKRYASHSASRGWRICAALIKKWCWHFGRTTAKRVGQRDRRDSPGSPFSTFFVCSVDSKFPTCSPFFWVFCVFCGF